MTDDVNHEEHEVLATKDTKITERSSFFVSLVIFVADLRGLRG